MWPKMQFPEDLVTFTEEIVNGKLHFLCSVRLNTDILVIIFGEPTRKWSESDPKIAVLLSHGLRQKLVMCLINLRVLVPDLVLVNAADYHWGCSAIYLVYLDSVEVLFALFYFLCSLH